MQRRVAVKIALKSFIPDSAGRFLSLRASISTKTAMILPHSIFTRIPGPKKKMVTVTPGIVAISTVRAGDCGIKSGFSVLGDLDTCLSIALVLQIQLCQRFYYLASKLLIQKLLKP